MRINNNISAMNTYSRLNSANNAKSGSLAKLSSGLRINRAGDDAAGLAISEKMRGQIGGLKQATRNAQDGISLIQTAEGGLNETHSILNRMRELAVQSANDTNTESDRGEIQKEMDELATEITRISTNTEFNTQKLLNGELANKGDHLTFQIGANKDQNLKLNIADMGSNKLGVAGNPTVKYDISKTGTFNIGDLQIAADSYKVEAVDKRDVITGIDIVDEAKYALKNNDGDPLALSRDGETWIFAESTAGTDSYIQEAFGGTEGDLKSIKLDKKITSGEITVANGDKDGGSLDTQMTISGTTETEFSSPTASLRPGTYEVQTKRGAEAAEVVLVDNGKIIAESDDGENWKLVGGEEVILETSQLNDGEELIIGSSGIDVSNQEAADKAIETIDVAIGKVSAERSKLGATQNRLDHTINNLTATAENLSEAESRIRDVDMAQEMMEFTKNNILSQAATSMLAQANQMPQSVLQLLQ